MRPRLDARRNEPEKDPEDVDEPVLAPEDEVRKEGGMRVRLAVGLHVRRGHSALPIIGCRYRPLRAPVLEPAAATALAATSNLVETKPSCGDDRDAVTCCDTGGARPLGICS